MARESSHEKLWSYAGLARFWSWTLIGVGVGLVPLSVGVQATAREGLDLGWFAVLLATLGLTGAVFFLLFRVWLRRSGLPSLYLPRATRMSGPRRLEASPADWRRWGLVTSAILFFASVMMLSFLVGVLKRGGIAEGVVVGTLVAWGLVTLEDAGRIRRAEVAEGRRYYAAARRPTGVGNRLVWTPRKG